LRTGRIIGGVALFAAVLGLLAETSSRSPGKVAPGTELPVVTLPDLLDFPGATGWLAGPCDEPSCTGEWRHTTGQRVQVLVVPVPDPRRLRDLTARLQDQALAGGGRVDFIDQAGGVLRMLRPGIVGDSPVVVLSYVLPAPDARALHIVTSTVPPESQEPGDARVRDLLAFAAWVRPPEVSPGVSP
jgi:hypothetical protein